MLRDHEDGLAIAPTGYTVANAATDWLSYGLNGRDKRTISTCTILSKTHITPSLGARKLRDLSAEDVERWLAGKATTLSTRTLQSLRSCLNRAINRAMARDKVKRNVVALCSVPKGQPGRPSKALTLTQAETVLAAAEHTRMRGYIVVSLLTGARTEELRALTWDHVDLTGKPDHDPPVPPHIAVWRSIRAGADTKTRKSRRTLALPRRCVAALEAQRRQQDQDRIIAAARWQDHHLVFASRVGTPLDIQRGNSRPIVTQLVTQRSGASSYTRVNWPLSRLDGIGVIRRYSNRPDLLEQLRKVAVMMLDGGQDDGTGAMVAVEYGVRSRRLRDRLFSEDLQTMIDLYRSGATAKAVAEKFGVSLRSVKRLLHRHGVRRKGRV